MKEKDEMYKQSIIRCLIGFCDNRDIVFNNTKDKLKDLNYEVLVNFEENIKKEKKNKTKRKRYI